MKYLVLLSLFVGNQLWASDCPDLTGSFKCPFASETLDAKAYVKDGKWHYEGDQLNVFGPLIADGIERVIPGYGGNSNVIARYRAYCHKERLYVEEKTRYSSGTEDGSRAVFRLRFDRFSTKSWYYDEYPQRQPDAVNWEEDIKGRQVKRDSSFNCRKI